MPLFHRALQSTKALRRFARGPQPGLRQLLQQATVLLQNRPVSVSLFSLLRCLHILGIFQCQGQQNLELASRLHVYVQSSSIEGMDDEAMLRDAKEC